MLRRLVCMAALLLLLLGAPACGDGKKNKAPTVPDPDGNYVPKPGGAKPG